MDKQINQFILQKAFAKGVIFSQIFAIVYLIEAYSASQLTHNYDLIPRLLCAPFLLPVFLVNPLCISLFNACGSMNFGSLLGFLAIFNFILTGVLLYFSIGTIVFFLLGKFYAKFYEVPVASELSPPIIRILKDSLFKMVLISIAVSIIAMVLYVNKKY